MDELDVSAVEDVNDVGSGEPLYANFAYEDWCLLNLRYEMCLLVHSFRVDLDDPDRTNFSEAHLGFYYEKYFRKKFNPKNFAVTSLEEVAKLVPDTLVIGSGSIVDSPLTPDMPHSHFVKLVEEDRRQRQQRSDAGDESAELQFPRASAVQQPKPPGSAPSNVAARPGQRPLAAGAAGGARPPPARPGAARPTYGGAPALPSRAAAPVSTYRSAAPPLGRPGPVAVNRAIPAPSPYAAQKRPYQPGTAPLGYQPAKRPAYPGYGTR
eukprot:gnl/TRDRNA2_/TRDRNA2_139815_c1_seq1.p1 gnl/TRDRNA2_/TRDRNA2_139815_c1~~gnl/TRDRNA2_/TRDRNA2_139815_c1_seq1.p1  ORF type:complete len:266 (-),score=37.85 gnl/TRDRNA2_/TRDRNA2_139815_c1_seq1:121-918(-)